MTKRTERALIIFSIPIIIGVLLIDPELLSIKKPILSYDNSLGVIAFLVGWVIGFIGLKVGNNVKLKNVG